jgi:cation:H+ antiporter
MLFLFSAFMYVTFAGTRGAVDDPQTTDKTVLQAHLYVIVGLVSLTAGGKLVVDSAIDIAVLFGLSEAFIGLTIVAVGTSLPELAATTVAAYRKQNDIAIGNVIGSNIFNLLWVLGVSAIINPIRFSIESNILLYLLMASSLLVIVLLKWNPKHRVERSHGLLFILLYLIFIYITALAQ